MELGKNIAKIRKDNNLTQDELAEKYFVTRQTISNWEIGKSYPDLETLVKISNDFNVSLDILLKEDDEMIKKIDNEVKGSKKYKNITKYLLILFGIIILSICIYLLMYFNFKNNTIDRFNNIAQNYKFIKDENGWYQLNQENKVIYTIPNPFPNFLDFKLDYEDKQLYCTIITGDDLKYNYDNGTGWSSEIRLHWTNDNKLLMESYACEDKSNFSSSLKDSNGNECDYYGLVMQYETENNIEKIKKIDFNDISKKLNIDEKVLKDVAINGTNMYNELYK